MTRAVTFAIPKALWLTSNRHTTNRPHRARIVRDLHDLAAMTAVLERLERFGAGPVRCDWTIRYPKGVSWAHGDAANAQPTTKALLDGLVPRFLDGDGPLIVVAEEYRRGPNLDRKSDHEIRLVITPQNIPWLDHDPKDQP